MKSILRNQKTTSEFESRTTKTTQQESRDGTEHNGDSAVTILPTKNRWGCARKNI